MNSYQAVSLPTLPLANPENGLDSRPRQPWLSAHLFLRNGSGLPAESADRVLLEIVEPFIRHCRRESWIQRYFFIRFDELGLHVRLRLQGEAEILTEAVRPALARTCRIEAEPWTDSAGLAYPCGHELIDHVRWHPYEPEWERYAGPEGTRAAEEFFFSSSEAALALLRPEGSAGRTARALLAMTVLLHAVSDSREQAIDLARSYSQFALDVLRRHAPASGQEDWRKAFEAGLARQSTALRAAVLAAWDGLGAGQELPEPFETYGQDLIAIRGRLEDLCRRGALVRHGRQLATWCDVIETLMPSYLHMMSNRLGISILDEAYLGHLACQFLAAAGVSL